jgi:DNA-binding LacI/PurR family transcriptional regulator
VPAATPPTGSSHRRRRVGIVDVAALAGVSRQTVSNVINGRKEYYSQDTCDRVLAAMEQLRYQPDRAAQSLRSRRSMQIGYHMFGKQLESVNGFFLHFLQALVKQASLDDYQMLVFTHHDDNPLEVFKELIARRSVDAFILSESTVDDPRVHLLADSRIPFASMGRLAPALPQQWVDVDNIAGMRPLVGHLVTAGHRGFAYVGDGSGNYWTTERFQGLQRGLAEYRLSVPAANVHYGDDLSVRSFIRRLLRRKRAPSAVVCSSDAVAAVVVNVAHSLGLVVGADIGRDVAVTGFDGGAIGMFTEPTLTSVRIPVEQIARELIHRCRREIESGPTDEPGLLVPTDLVLGGSA